jgi:two-component system, cell cycle sensor histidine kinase and response regulator CckA
MPHEAQAEPLVLVVDDEAVVRDVTALLLENAGFRVVAAASGEEALALLERDGDVEVALLDAMLPDHDGGEIAAALRRRRPGLPIVVASGYDEETVTRQVGQIPGARFLRKPYASSELVATLAAAIGP